MLMSPMFVFAKMYVALGLRPDLEPIVRKPALQAAQVSPHQARADMGRRS
jgi:uncharacterized membrane protein YGL010W